MTDPLSPLAHEIIKAGSYTQIVVDGPAPAAGRALLDDITPDQLLTVPITSYPHAAAMLAGLWLWHDGLDECHRIAQKQPADLRPPSRLANFTSEAPDAASTLNFWHAIMHRREGDFSNSKYWYHRCATHPMLPAIGQQAADALNPLPADKSFLRLLRNGWDPDAFVDLAASRYRDREPARLPMFVTLQKIEWRMLFDHCTRQATSV